MEPKPSAAPQTVLLVDDDKTTVRVLKEKLIQQGYTVLSATGGDEALDVARRHQGPIDLLLADVVMPGVNGPRLAELLLVTRPDTRILFMSGLTNAAAIPLSLRHRSSFVQKQHPIDGVLQSVEKILRRSSS
jgi:two-component system, cell cycle sensor histidine kinase and response regulator CckA